MIKKTLLSLLIFGLGFFGISFGNMYIQEIGLNLTNSGSNWQYYINVDENLNFYSVPTNSENSIDNILFILGNGNTGTKFFMGWKGNKLYGYGYFNFQSRSPIQGYVNNIYSVQVNTYGGTELRTFTQNQATLVDTIDNIGNYVNNLTYYAFGDNSNFGYIPVLCFTSDETLYTNSGGTQNQWYCLILDSTDSENYSINSVVDPVQIISTIGFDSSPVGSSGGGNENPIVGIELGSNESAINYFEKNYGRNENICYVGIDNVTDLWGSSVSFEYGTGLSIFETFNSLYGNTDLDKVYVWLNSWIINYTEWFGRGGNPLYLASYNSGTNQVDLRYDNLTFPFSGNPVAVYFMTNNIDNFGNPSGSEIVSYCNLKINNGSFNDIIDQATKNNITSYTEQSNKNNGLNPDGTNKNHFGSGFIFTGNIGEYTGVTWDQLQYSGDVNLKSFFDNALEEMKGALDNFQNPLTGMLPSYIIYAFLFVALFKLLRK